MGMFDFLKKKSVPPKAPGAVTPETNSFDRLTQGGELPFGWVTHKKEFTSKIQGEFSYFLNTWLESRNKSPKEQHSALKSLILYLEDVEKLCKSKGECYEFWFYEILVTKDYIQKRKNELAILDTEKTKRERKTP